MTTFADLHAELDFMQRYGMTAAYKDKQMHPLPELPVIPADQRVAYIAARAKGLRVLNIGSASGDLHEAIKATALSIIGVDHEPSPQTDIWLDLDDYEAVQAWQVPQVDLIVFAETLEHIVMPGAILRKLHAAQAPLLVTTPNAYAQSGSQWVLRGWENVNREHTCWYSYHTLTVTLERTGWHPDAWAYYGHGPIGLNEGLICIARSHTHTHVAATVT